VKKDSKKDSISKTDERLLAEGSVSRMVNTDVVWGSVIDWVFFIASHAICVYNKAEYCTIIVQYVLNFASITDHPNSYPAPPNPEFHVAKTQGHMGWRVRWCRVTIWVTLERVDRDRRFDCNI